MELTASKIFKVIFSHIWIILLCAILLGGAGYAYSHYNIPPTYTSSMKLMVTSQDSVSNYSEITAMRRMVNTYVEMLDSRDFYDVIRKECDLNYSASQLKSMITYTTKEDSEAFTATVVTLDPNECSKIIQCLDEQVHKYVSQKYNKLTITSVESPNTPYKSSNTMRNAVVAFLAGMMLSAAIIVIWNEFDVRIKAEEDLRARYNIPILGVVPTFDLKKKHSAKNDNHSHREDTIADQEVTFDEKK